jgi:hypothetical protein
MKKKEVPNCARCKWMCGNDIDCLAQGKEIAELVYNSKNCKLLYERKENETETRLLKLEKKLTKLVNFYEEITLEKATDFAMATDYACFACDEDNEINTADAGAFLIEGVKKAVDILMDKE